MYPPGEATFQTTLSLHTEALLFCKIWDLIRIWSAHFWRENLWIRSGSEPDQISKIFFKFQTSLFPLETPEAIYNSPSPGGWHGIRILHWTEKSKKFTFNSYDVQSHFSLKILDWNSGSDPDQSRIRSQLKKEVSYTFMHVRDTENHLQLTHPRGMTYNTNNSLNREIFKLWSNSFGVQSQFFIQIVDWNCGLDPEPHRLRWE